MSQLDIVKVENDISLTVSFDFIHSFSQNLLQSTKQKI